MVALIVDVSLVVVLIVDSEVGLLVFRLVPVLESWMV